MSLRLVGDIGGTNSRFALWDSEAGRLRETRSLANAHYPQLVDAISRYLDDLDVVAPREACLAIAAPPTDDQVSMTNANWTFSKRALRSQLALNQLQIINDFEAIALALPYLQHSQLMELRKGQANAGHPNDEHLVVLGPGTGLGGSKLLRCGAQRLTVACEPGETTIAPGNARERELFAILYRELDEVHAEDLLSGPGLQRLYRASAHLLGETEEKLEPADITSRAMAGESPACHAALSSFCALLGSAAANFVLSNGAYGGLYLAGGILPRLPDYLRESDFLDRFTQRRAMTPILATVPVFLIVEAQPGLLGAAHATLP